MTESIPRFHGPLKPAMNAPSARELAKLRSRIDHRLHKTTSAPTAAAKSNSLIHSAQPKRAASANNEKVSEPTTSLTTSHARRTATSDSHLVFISVRTGTKSTGRPL